MGNIDDKDREDSSLDELGPFLPSSSVREDGKRHRQKRTILIYCLAAMLAVSLGANILTYIYIHSDSFLDPACILHTQQNPTPVDIPLHFGSVRYDGRFLSNSSSIYRQPPSPEVDAAWEALGTTSKPLILSPSQAKRAGLSPDHLKTPSGDFPTYFEFDHHLHCLNMVRKSLFYNYDYYSSPNATHLHIGKNHMIVAKHVTHCIDMLRQVIQCKPDLGVFGLYWVKDEVEGIDGSFVDFDTDHKCIDWEALKGWVANHQTEGMKVELREGDKILDAAP
ncbi:hypothetical protein BGZ63DRAFT_466409 [Mariannaea sp. PMI_226]|nr:hypothetical protein BGZ63DRAFT_466409 [Mariannaea sp. PMI_226]